MKKIMPVKDKISNEKLNEIVAIENYKVSDWMTVNLGFDLELLEKSANFHGISIDKPEKIESTRDIIKE